MGATLLISVLARPPSSSPGSPTVSQQGKDTVGGGNMNVCTATVQTLHSLHKLSPSTVRPPSACPADNIR